MTQLDQQTPEQHRQRYEQLKAQARQGRGSAAPRRDIGSLDDSRVIRRETIPGGWYATFPLRRFERLRIVNASGASSVAALLWNADDTSERYNAGDTVKLQWSALLTRGRVLFSDMGRVLASITEDTSGAHDALVGGSTARTHPAPARNTRDNFRLAVGKLGLTRHDVPPCLTFFAGVRTDDAGRFVWHGTGAPGDAVELRAEMNVLVALSNCRHPLDPRDGDPEPVEAIRWRGDAPQSDDLCRTVSEEAVRGFENTDALFAGG